MHTCRADLLILAKQTPCIINVASCPFEADFSWLLLRKQQAMIKEMRLAMMSFFNKMNHTDIDNESLVALPDLRCVHEHNHANCFCNACPSR